jgi:hypothetical protein
MLPLSLGLKWREGKQIPPKYRHPPTKLCGVTLQKTVTIIVTTWRILPLRGQGCCIRNKWVETAGRLSEYGQW